MLRGWFNLVNDALMDPKAYGQMRNEVLAKIDEDQLYNKLKGKEFFRAICLTGAQDSTSPAGTFYPIKVRPLEIHEFLLEDPCSEKFKDDPEQVKRLIDLHPTAYAEFSYTAGHRTPAFGETIQCKYLIDGPNNNGRMMGLRYVNPTGLVNYNFTCANQEFQSLVGMFVALPGTMVGPNDGGTGIYGPSNPSSLGLQAGDPGPPPNPLPSSAMNGGVIAKFEADLGAALKAKGLPFKVTDRSRTVDQQMQRVMAKYKRKGAGEVISTYGNRGRRMVKAIEAGDRATFRKEASRSSRHLKGAAIDIRVNHYKDEQMPEVLKTIRSLGGNPLIEPMTGGCWDKPGRNLTHPKRPRGIWYKGCNNQHIHIDIPTNYPDNLKAS